MNAVFLTSAIDLYSKDENGVRVPHHFGNKNGLLDNLKKYIKKYDNFLYVASVEDRYADTDVYAGVTIESFKQTLPFKNYNILDGRTKAFAKQLVEKADFIILAGGHVPTQNAFFNKIGLDKLIKNTNAVVCGGSAGSMNCAKTVYCPPELDGEALDPNFVRFFPGLGLVNFNIMPHYNEYLTEMLDGFRVIEDIVVPDSFKTDIYCISDGGYFLCDKDVVTVYGETYLIKNGVTTKICEDEETKPIMFNTNIGKSAKIL